MTEDRSPSGCIGRACPTVSFFFSFSFQIVGCVPIVWSKSPAECAYVCVCVCVFLRSRSSILRSSAKLRRIARIISPLVTQLCFSSLFFSLSLSSPRDERVCQWRTTATRNRRPFSIFVITRCGLVSSEWW